MATPSTVHQLVLPDGKPAREAHSTPKWFVNDHVDLQVKNYGEVLSGTANVDWGKLFADAQPGNAVEFFTTGASYFSDVAAAISSAKVAVFIAGWQVNYDVELTPGKTLFHCLRAALDGGAAVYVMPWQSPKVGVDTGDLETLLAVNHLNAGRSGAQAHCLPALQQGDQGTLGIFFSHHQKLVVVDNQAAYVGGIDLAYGRRDDNNFAVKAQGRTLNEFYSPCVPPVHAPSNVEQQHTVTRMELLAAALTSGTTQKVATFATSPSEGVVAKGLDLASAAGDKLQDAKAAAAEVWNSVDLLPRVTGPLQDMAADQAQAFSRWAWSRLDAGLQEKLTRLRETGSAHAADAAAAVLAWLNNGDLSRLPPRLTGEVASAIQALSFGLAAGMPAAVRRMPKRYERLFEKVKTSPKGLVPDAATQPRMPWQDVHCRIKGPAVYDLARNFTLRWAATRQLYTDSAAKYRHALAEVLLDYVGIRVPAAPILPQIAAAHQPRRDSSKKGGNWVQVLRSAPMQLQDDEAKAAGARTKHQYPQNNCLKAMLKAIAAAQQFIYIEGQFFQSAYGEEGDLDPAISGPLGALLDIRRAPQYRKFARMLEIDGVLDPKQIPGRIRWAKVDDVLEQAQGPEFMADLKRVLAGLASVEFTRVLAPPQARLKNPISKALVNRIEAAINDGLPFHVYLVLPVHPEGTLNTLNIMTQVHLTMQSLVFGEHSLVNGVRRAILAQRLRKQRGLAAGAARREAYAVPVRDLEVQLRDEWKQYLTLLNLRNWDTLNGKPVTEQIYVHSKLLIADDRVAILGSANINDRSQLGDRDSELAVIVTDDTPVTVKLDGVHPQKVAASVHKLRRSLWEKLFGLKSANRAAPSLAAVLDHPAAPQTWRAIQAVADDNAKSYEAAFWFIPRSAPPAVIQPKEAADKSIHLPPASIWPTWRYKTYLTHKEGGQLAYRMPFDELFWREPKRGDVSHSWNVGAKATRGNAPMRAPEDVLGFIVALPTRWTYHENNNSGMNLTALAGIVMPTDTQVASAEAEDPAAKEAV